MNDLLEPLPLFPLPDWARWFGWIDLNSKLKIQVLSLMYPRWNSAFYPIFLDQDCRPLFDLPNKLSAAVSDGRTWLSCPEVIYFSEETSQVIVDYQREGDHPIPAGSTRQLISPPNFTAKVAEDHLATYGSDLKDPGGDVIPRLSAVSGDFKARKVVVFNPHFSPQKP